MFRKKRCERKRSRDLSQKIRTNFRTKATNPTKADNREQMLLRELEEGMRRTKERMEKSEGSANEV